MSEKILRTECYDGQDYLDLEDSLDEAGFEHGDKVVVIPEGDYDALHAYIDKMEPKVITYDDRRLIEWALDTLESHGLSRLRPDQAYRLRALLARAKGGVQA